MAASVDFYGPNGAHQYIFETVTIAMTALSCVISVVMIALVYQMGYRTKLLIWSMTWCQFLYDLAFYPAFALKYSNAGIQFISLIAIGSIVAVCVFANVISGSILYTLITRRSVDVQKCYWWFCAIAAVPVIVIVIPIMVSYIDPINYTFLESLFNRQVRYYFVLTSIFSNFLICGFSYFYTRQLQSSQHSNSSKALQAICLLVQRLQYYPMVQALSRSGLAWYQFVYGTYAAYNPPAVTPDQFAAQMYTCIVTPTASVGYFIIFLLVQPTAYSTFRSWFSKPKQWLFGTATDHSQVDWGMRSSLAIGKTSPTSTPAESRITTIFNDFVTEHEEEVTIDRISPFFAEDRRSSTAVSEVNINIDTSNSNNARSHNRGLETLDDEDLMLIITPDDWTTFGNNSRVSTATTTGTATVTSASPTGNDSSITREQPTSHDLRHHTDSSGDIELQIQGSVVSNTRTNL